MKCKACGSSRIVFDPIVWGYRCKECGAIHKVDKQGKIANIHEGTWYSCEEEQPPDLRSYGIYDTPYLAVIRTPDGQLKVTMMHWMDICGELKWAWWMDAYLEPHEPLAWMALPKPPEDLLKKEG